MLVVVILARDDPQFTRIFYSPFVWTAITAVAVLSLEMDMSYSAGGNCISDETT